MKNILLLMVGILTLHPSFAFSTSVKELLSIKPGEKKNVDLKLTDSIDGGTYTIETDGTKVESIKIDFTSPVNSSDFVAKETKGYCLTQPVGPHIALNRVFFFDLKKQSRYELNPQGLIKSILIEDIPGARANRECKFSEAQKSSAQTEAIKKVK